MSLPKLIAHLDLKGVHLKEACFRQYFENLHRLGYDAVLVEYEDVFPYRSISPALDKEEVWSLDFLRTFQSLAEEHAVEIIPLQQCFGHLEYLFRWPEYAPFSLPHGVRPRELHIDSKEARAWFFPVLEEVLSAHRQSRFIHLGMDEALSLVPYARACQKAPMELFLGYLEELCALCAAYGKIPVIWSDMLEDHISPDNIEKIRALHDRVILAHWNYFSGEEPDEVVRFSGKRCAKKLTSALETMKQPLDEAVEWTEDWPEEIKDLAGSHQHSSGHFAPFFQAAIWKALGFRVWGAAGAGITQDRRLLPYYHWRRKNILAWKAAVDRHHLDGLLITQWGRANSCAGPNLFPDVCWPLLEVASRSAATSSLFFPEISWEQQQRLFLLIGRCREDWRMEGRLIVEMQGLAEQVTTNAYEWKTLILMLRILDCTKSIDETLHLVECYEGMGRMMASGWTREHDFLRQLRSQLATLETEAVAHLSRRYGGRSLREWFDLTFQRQRERLDTGLSQIEDSMQLATRLFQRPNPEAAR